MTENPFKRTTLLQQISIFILTFVCVALFPVLFLYSNNVNQIQFDTMLRSLLLTLFGSMIALCLFTLVTRDFRRSVIITVVLLLLFFSYGHVYGMIKNSSIFGAEIGRHRFIAPIWFFIFFLSLWIVFKKIMNPGKVIRVLLPISLMLVMLPLVNILWFSIETNILDLSAMPLVDSSNEVPTINQDSSNLPDVYYIIMDGYPRQDTLEEVFDFNNEPFLQDLEELGFYVARCSQPNYAETEQSLASSLNMNYLQKFGVEFEPDKRNHHPIRKLIKQSKILQILSDLGYSSIAFETGFDWANMYDVDLFLEPSTYTLDKWDLRAGLNGFELMLIKSSLGLLVVDGTMVLPSIFALDLENPNQIRREQILFSLNQLKELPSYPGPKFVFTHIISPHFPIVFTSDGAEVVDPMVNDEQASLDLRKAAYRDQLSYLNSVILDLLAGIIQDSKLPPIIIIQGDHGPKVIYTDEDIQHRMKILNAYYIPDNLDSQSLYPHITPVNSFRLLFNSFLDTDFILLEDVSYYSEYDLPYSYAIVENDCTTEHE